MTGEAPRPQPKPAKRVKSKPTCQCGKPCAWYGPVGGYSVACIGCNGKNATRQRRARKALVRTRMKRRPPRRLKRAGSDPAYLAWVRTQRCMVAPNYPVEWCWGRVHAHHAGRKPGVAMKAPDATAIPLCERHHRHWHNAAGYFFGMEKFERALWASDAIAATQAAWSRA